MFAGCAHGRADAASRPKTRSPSPIACAKALEKSLLFPGLGQLAEKQYVKAAVFAAAEIFCLAQVVIHIGKGNEAYRNYRDAVDAAAAVEWRLQTEKYDRRRNTAILAGAGVWVLNMIDIFVFAKKKYGRNAVVAFHPYYNHENQAFGAGLRCIVFSLLFLAACNDRLFDNPNDPDAETRAYEILSTMQVVGIVPVDLTFSGNALWAVDAQSRILSLNYSSGALIRELDFPAAGGRHRLRRQRPLAEH